MLKGLYKHLTAQSPSCGDKLNRNTVGHGFLSMQYPSDHDRKEIIMSQAKRYVRKQAKARQRHRLKTLTGKRFSNVLRRNNGNWLIFIKLVSILMAGNPACSPLYRFGESTTILLIPYCFFSRKAGVENTLILGSKLSVIEVCIGQIFEDGNTEASVLRPVFLPFFFPLLGFRRGEDGWTLGNINGQVWKYSHRPHVQ
jgi:hypothetical protein